MRIMIAPDSFKGSLSASEICDLVERAAKEVFVDCEVEKMPVADGGEGTVESILATLEGEKVVVEVKDPLGRDIVATYGVFNDNKAVIEMAEASGLPLVSTEDRDVMHSNTFGTGQLILDAIEKGCTTIYMAIGGSATNDGGMGCANALGVKFLDENEKELKPVPANLLKIKTVDISGISKKIRETNFVILSDVKNSLLGERGATYVFGKQKGATIEEQAQLEAGLAHYIAVVEKAVDQSICQIEGAGAAGGLGAGLMAFTNATMRSGVETVLEILDFEEKIQDVKLVVTGEGRMDYQSAYGKVAYGVGSLCKKNQIPCVAIVGGMGEHADAMYEHGISSIMTTVNGVMSMEEAVEHASELCTDAAERLFRLVKLGMTVKE